MYVRTHISPGSVTDTDTEYRGISKYQYRYRSRYSKYRKIPKKKYRRKNTEKNGKSVFQFCKYNTLVIRVYAGSVGQLSQIESFPPSVSSVILHKIVDYSIFPVVTFLHSIHSSSYLGYRDLGQLFVVT